MIKYTLLRQMIFLFKFKIFSKGGFEKSFYCQKVCFEIFDMNYFTKMLMNYFTKEDIKDWFFCFLKILLILG